MDQPWYGIGLWPAIKILFRKGFTFSGRASRNEYWWPQVFLLIVGLLFWIVTILLPRSSHSDTITIIVGIVLRVINLVFWIPILAVTWRRMQDIGKPGWVGLILALIPWALNVFTTGTLSSSIVIYALDAALFSPSLLVIEIVIALIALACELVLIVFMLTPTRVKGLKYDPRGNDGFLPDYLIPAAPPGPADPPPDVRWEQDIQ